MGVGELLDLPGIKFFFLYLTMLRALAIKLESILLVRFGLQVVYHYRYLEDPHCQSKLDIIFILSNSVIKHTTLMGIIIH